MDYLVLVPVYNCEFELPLLLPNLKQENTLIINDGSIDNSKEIILASGFNYIDFKRNYGVGHAIKSGIKYAIKKGFEYCVTLDGDNQHDPKFIKDFRQALNFNDFVIGNRFSDLHKIPESKISSNLLAKLIILDAFRLNIPDVTCGFRAFKINKSLLAIKGNEFDFLYYHLIDAILNEKKIGSVRIECRYDYSTLLCTKIREIEGFINVLEVCDKNKDNYIKYDRVLKSIKKKSDFIVTVKNLTFYAFFIKNHDSYILQVKK